MKKMNKLYAVFFNDWEIWEPPRLFADENAARAYIEKGIDKLLEYHDLEVFGCKTKEEFFDEIVSQRHFKDFIQYNYAEIENGDTLTTANYLLSLLEY